LAPVFVAGEDTPAAIDQAAAKHDCDLLLLGGPGRRGSDARRQWIVQVVRQASGAVLVCT
jgi:nucleotide-binding universal stress UspA family protein